jgi:hypothetical protein
MRILALTLVLLFLFLGCAKKEDAVTAVPTTAEDIDKAQAEAFGDIDPFSIKTGEFVYTIKTQQVFSSQEPQEALLEEEGITITDRIDYANYVEFTLVKELIDHTLPDSPRFKFKDVLFLSRETENQNAEEPVDTPDLEDPSGVAIEFFNLKVVPDTIRKPAKVLEREPCVDNEAACFIAVKKITYDVRVTLPQEQPITSSLEIWISNEVPYLAAVLKSCFKTVAIIDDSRPLVVQCTQVVDYKFE